MPDFASKYGRPLGASRDAMGGAALNMGIEALTGEIDMITVFDDFNGFVDVEGFGDTAYLTTMGWVGTDDTTPTADAISMNDVSATTGDFDSCLRIFPGTDDDDGGNLQLDLLNGGIAATTVSHDFPHLWLPETAGLPSRGAGGAATALDDTTWVFACRLGLNADITGTGTDWEGKMFIGWAVAADATILDADTGDITTTNGELFGFHVTESGAIEGVSKRTAGDAMIDGTNYTTLLAASSADNTVANGARVKNDTMWFDLALRIDILDMSSSTANGSTRFFYRGPLNRASALNAGKDEFAKPGEGYYPWREHSTVLLNETPNGAVSHVPTIECLNGPTGGLDCCMYVDWWAFGRNRISR